MSEKQFTPTEKQFTQAVVQALSAQGYRGVEVDSILHPGNIRADIVAHRDSVSMAVEVRAEAGGVLDAISRAAYMRLLPTIVESYIAIPSQFITSEILRHAGMVGVGVFGVSGNSISLTQGAQPLTANLSFSFGYPSKVLRGQDLIVQITVGNRGQKLVVNLKIGCTLAYPFIASISGKNEAVLESLEPGERETVTVYVAASPKAVPGIYPLFIKAEGPGFEPNISNVSVTVA